jgi:IclR family acetate operon transcriptional repressor
MLFAYHRKAEAELRQLIEHGYGQSFADFSRDLAWVALPLPIGDRRLSVVVAGPEFRMAAKMAEVAAIMTKSIQRHCPSPEQSKAIQGVPAR